MGMGRTNSSSSFPSKESHGHPPSPPPSPSARRRRRPPPAPEATMICVDDSEWMRNGDYPPTRFQAQSKAVDLVFLAKRKAHPKNTVGVLAMAGDRVRVLLAPRSSDTAKFIACTHGLKESGEANLTVAIQDAQLALKSHPDKSLRQRIVVFVGSPVQDEKSVLEAIGRKLKKNNVSLDVVDFGESGDEKAEKLQALVAAVNVGGNSHMVHVPPGEAALHDVLARTPIITGDEGEGAAAGGASRFEYGVDPNVDPELAVAHRLSMDGAIARQEAAEESSKAENKCKNTDTVTAEPESDSDTYVPYADFIKTDAFVLGVEQASDPSAEDERIHRRAMDDEARVVRRVLRMLGPANASDSEMSDDSSSEWEWSELDLELALHMIEGTGFWSEGEDVFDSSLRLDPNHLLRKNLQERLAALRVQREQEEEEEEDEQEEEEGGDAAENY